MPGTLTTLQIDTADIIKSDEYFARIEPLYEQLGDLTNKIRVALNKLGISVLVLTPSAVCQSTNAPGPILDPVTLVVQVVENVLLNQGASGTQLPAGDVAEKIAWLLHYPNHAGRGDTFPLTCRSIRLVPDKTLLVYNVEFTCQTALAGIVATT
jgi:hypothetical protein